MKENWREITLPSETWAVLVMTLVFLTWAPLFQPNAIIHPVTLEIEVQLSNKNTPTQKKEQSRALIPSRPACDPNSGYQGQTVDEGADQSMFLHGREMIPTDTEQKHNQIWIYAPWKTGHPMHQLGHRLYHGMMKQTTCKVV